MTRTWEDEIFEQTEELTISAFFDLARDIAASEHAEEQALEECERIVDETMRYLYERGMEKWPELQYQAYCLCMLISLAAAEMVAVMHFSQLESEIGEIEGGVA